MSSPTPPLAAGPRRRSRPPAHRASREDPRRAEREQHRAIHPAERPDPAALAERAQEARAELDRLLDEAAEGLPRSRTSTTPGTGPRSRTPPPSVPRRCWSQSALRSPVPQTPGRLPPWLTSPRRRGGQGAFAAMTSARLAHAAWKVKAEAHEEKRAATIAAARKGGRRRCSRGTGRRAAGAGLGHPSGAPSSPSGARAGRAGRRRGAAADARAVVEMAKRAEAEAARAAEGPSRPSPPKAQVLADTCEAIATTGLRACIRAVLEGAALTGWRHQRRRAPLRRPRPGR